ncbi:hypothetical protein HID58_007330, partial [Brassica napus]
SNSSSPSGSTTSTPSGSAGPTGSSLSGSESSATTTVAELELEGETSKEVMSFIMNLEKKCPPKEEYKSFEKLKDTMVASAAEKKKVSSLELREKYLMPCLSLKETSRNTYGSISMEKYHQEVVKALQELETIHSKIISATQGKKDENNHQTKWEQVTTQFVETEASSNTTVDIDKVKLT